MVPRRGGLWSPHTKQFRYNEKTGELWFWIKFKADKKDYECGYTERLLICCADSIFSEGEVCADKFSATLKIYPEYMGKREIYRYFSDLPDLSAELIITKLDTSENIISGTFAFEMYQNVGDVDDYDFENKLIISEGRFDFVYCPQGETIKGYTNDD